MCHSFKVDSYTHAVFAYKVWYEGAAFDDLIPDKPAGYALLTGWSFYLHPGAPTRLALVPIESASLIAAYIVFWRLARRFFDPRLSATLTLFLAIAHNAYNVLDFVTDGFNLQEAYLAPLMLLGAIAHLTVRRPLWAGLLCGLGLGAATSIKQSAVTLLAVCFIHEVWRSRQRGGLKTALVPCAGMAIGVIAGWIPALGYVAAKGWLVPHLSNLAAFSGGHMWPTELRFPPWYNVSPLLPAAWWVLLGLLGAKWGLPIEEKGTKARRHEGTEAMSDEAAIGDSVPSAVDPWPFPWFFFLLWGAVEIAMVWSMFKPASHYYQQLVAPIVMVSGQCFACGCAAVNRLALDDALRVRRWIAVATATLVVIAAAPVLAEFSRRIHTFDYQEEVEEFAVRLQKKPRAAVWWAEPEGKQNEP